jgi:ABC-type multidrug transport system fused ATPase/permease subunit
VEHQDSPNPIHRTFARLLDRILAGNWPGSNGNPLRTNEGALRVLLAAALISVLLLAVVRQLRDRALIRTATDLVSTLRGQLHRHVYRIGLTNIPGITGGGVADRFIRELDEVRDGIIAHLGRLTTCVTLVAGLIALILLVSPVWGLVIAALIVGSWLIARPLRRHLDRDSEAAARNASVQLDYLREDLSLVRTVRVYGVEEEARRRFENHLEGYQAQEQRKLLADSRRRPMAWILWGIAAVLAVGTLGTQILREPRGSIGLVGAVTLLVCFACLVPPLRGLLRARRHQRRAGRGVDSVFGFLERQPELLQSVKAAFLPPVKDRITFESVSLDAPNGRPLLAGVSLEIPAKTRTAVMGLDDTSKQALVCLIPRLLDPQIGRVRIDGHDLRDVTLESLRAQVSLVLQSDLVFNDSVMANVGLGDQSYSLPRVIEAAKLAHAHHFIQDLPNGYDTPIGSMGHYLKPDELYRIALARAFLHDPAIVILEEPEAPLSDEVKQLIDDTVDRLSVDRTLIFLPRRVSTLRKCQQVVVIHGGKIEAYGPPRDLHVQSKLFRQISAAELGRLSVSELEAEPA